MPLVFDIKQSQKTHVAFYLSRFSTNNFFLATDKRPMLQAPGNVGPAPPDTFLYPPRLYPPPSLQALIFWQLTLSCVSSNGRFGGIRLPEPGCSPLCVLERGWRNKSSPNNTAPSSSIPRATARRPPGLQVNTRVSALSFFHVLP